MNTKRILLLLAIHSLFHLADLSAQNSQALLNEIGIFHNGGYLELLIIGDLSEPENTLNMTDWKIDNAPDETTVDLGQIKFGDCLSSLQTGALILIYDDASPHADIDPSLDGLPNAKGVFQIAFSDPCIIKCSKGYYNNCVTQLPATTNWNEIFPIQLSGDAIEIRNHQNKLDFAVNWSGDLYVDKSHINTTNLSLTIPLITEGVLGAGGDGNENSLCGAEDIAETIDIIINASPGDANNSGNGGIIDNLSSGKIQAVLTISCATLLPSQRGESGVIDILIQNGEPPYTVEWSGVVSGNSTKNKDGTFGIENLPNGEYDIVVTDNKGCEKKCSTLLAREDDIKTCKGKCIDIGESSPHTGYCYRWTPAEDFADPNAANQNICPTEEKAYTLTIINDKGEVVEKRIFDIQLETGELFIEPNVVILCDVPREIDAGDGYSSYQWSNGETRQIIHVAPPDFGEYSVTVTDPAGCILEGKVSVIDANNTSSIAQYFEKISIVQYDINILRNAVKGSGSISQKRGSSSAVEDFAEKIVFVTEHGVELNPAADILGTLEDFMARGLEGKGFVTSSANFCENGANESIEYVKSYFEKPPIDVHSVIWAHICERCGDNGSDKLYISFSGSGKHGAAPPPFEPIDDCPSRVIHEYNPWILKATKGANNTSPAHFCQFARGEAGSDFFGKAIGAIGEAFLAEYMAEKWFTNSNLVYVGVQIPGMPRNHHIDVIVIQPLIRGMYLLVDYSNPRTPGGAIREQRTDITRIRFLVGKLGVLMFENKVRNPSARPSEIYDVIEDGVEKMYLLANISDAARLSINHRAYERMYSNRIQRAKALADFRSLEAIRNRFFQRKALFLETGIPGQRSYPTLDDLYTQCRKALLGIRDKLIQECSECRP